MGEKRTSDHSKAKFDTIYENINNQNTVHLLCTRAYFLRMSWTNKLKFLTCLLKNVRSNESLAEILNILYLGFEKMVCYAKCTTKSPFYYDKILKDHDRMLTTEKLKENFLCDLNWYRDMSDARQASVLIDMLRNSDGAILRIFCERLRKLYAERSQIQANQPEVKVAQVALWDAKAQKTSNKQAKKVEPVDAVTQEVQKQTKKWDNAIKKYRTEIENKSNPKENIKAGKKGKKPKKKKEKKGNKGKKGARESNELDWLQMLPIWTVKKIFSYLDPNSLKTAAKVNKYWSSIISELNADRQTRKNLNKVEDELFQLVSPNLRASLSRRDIQIEQRPKTFKIESKLEKLEQRGAILLELRRSIPKNNLTEQGVLQSVIVEMADTYIPRLTQTCGYPRVKKSETPIYPTFTKAKPRNHKSKTEVRATVVSSMFTIPNDAVDPSEESKSRDSSSTRKESLIKRKNL